MLGRRHFLAVFDAMYLMAGKEKAMNVSYDHYRIFYYVAKCRSITQAASMLLSNQPNITRTIKTLEGELGCALFVRSRQGMQLTPEGEKLFEHIRIAVDHIQAGEEELALDKTLQRGTISIGASEVALHCLLLPILKEYRQLYPDIHIRVSNHSTPQAISALKNGLVDIAVVTSPADIPDPLTSTAVKSFQEIPVCGSAFSHLQDTELSLSDLASLPLICLGKQTMTYAFYSDLFLRQGLPFSPSIEAATADQILPLVKNDLGIGFVPEALLDPAAIGDSLYLLRLKDPIPTRNICLVKRTGFSLNLAARKLETMIKSSSQQTGLVPFSSHSAR